MDEVDKIIEAEGWDESEQLHILLRFVEEHNLELDLIEFLGQVIEEGGD